MNTNLDLSAEGFSLTNAGICAQACADSYLSAERGVRSAESPIPNSEFRISNCATDTHVLIRDLGNAVVVAFRGSASLRNWLTDFDAAKEAIGMESKVQGPKSKVTGHVHQGFWDAFQSVRDELQCKVQSLKSKVVFMTGHSLGGALAAVAGIESGTGPEDEDEKSVHSVYTFGQPRVGDARFAEEAGRCGIAGRHFRVTNGADIVPWVPGWLMGYRHFGQHVHFDGLGMHVNPLPGAELVCNGLEMWREFRRGDAAVLADHAIAKYQECLTTD